MLWATGSLTVEKVRAAKAGAATPSEKKAFKLPVVMNPNTGKQSARHTAFSDVGWGKVTNSYLAAIVKNIDNTNMERIMEKAKDFSKAVVRDEDFESMLGSFDPDDDRANLVACSEASSGGEDEDEDPQPSEHEPEPEASASHYQSSVY